MRKTKILVIISLMAMLLMGCSQNQTNTTAADKLNIICTTFAHYDWARNIIGESNNINLTLLIDNGTDIHSYQPSTKDVAAIKSCDLIIYNGGISEEWIEAIIEDSNTRSLSLIDLLEDDIYYEEMVMGIESHEGHNHAEHKDHEEIVDEHIWLSLENAIKCSQAIGQLVSDLDEENASIYQSNMNGYIEKLEALHHMYEETVNNASKNTIIVADRFPLIYMVLEYGIDYYAAFDGCSAETEASFETVAFLSEKMRELDISKIIILDNSTTSLADTIISNTNKEGMVYRIKSMQSVNKKEIDAGMTYLNVMEDNCNVFKEVLN